MKLIGWNSEMSCNVLSERTRCDSKNLKELIRHSCNVLQYCHYSNKIEILLKVINSFDKILKVDETSEMYLIQMMTEVCIYKL